MLATMQGMVLRTDGTAGRERYERYGGGLFPVAWYDLQQFWAAHLPQGALQIGSTFERYEEAGDAVTVHLKVGVRVQRCAPLYYLLCRWQEVYNLCPGHAQILRVHGLSW